MARLLIVKTGSTFPEIAEQHGDFDTMFERVMGREGLQISRCDVEQGQPLPEHASVDAVVVTGSPAMVTDRAPWSEEAARWLKGWVEAGKPVLGVCYGHQLLAHALGGTVGDHPDGREMGTLDVRLNKQGREDPLLGSLPERFPAHLTHRQSVTGLPPGAVLLADSEQEPHQAFRVGDCAWGLQFHPEFDQQIMKAYIRRQRSVLAEEGRDPARMDAEVQETPAAQELLIRFVQLAMD